MRVSCSDSRKMIGLGDCVGMGIRLWGFLGLGRKTWFVREFVTVGRVSLLFLFMIKLVREQIEAIVWKS